MESLTQISILDGAEAPKLSKAELRKVKEFQNKVKGLEYKRMSSKYSAKTGPPIKMLRPSKSEMRKVYDTISPLISVFVTLICCIFGTNYFLKNVIHDFVGRFAIGLAAGSVLGIVSKITMTHLISIGIIRCLRVVYLLDGFVYIFTK